MKRLMSILAAAMIAATLTGCASNSSHKKVHLNIQSNEATIADGSTTGTTTAALPITSQTSDTNRRPTITKKNVDRDLSTAAKFSYQGRNWEGVLHLTGDSFIFSPKEGEEVYFPLSSILLVIVDYEMDKDYETLGLFTASDEFEFKVEIGYTNKISDYVLVSESAI